jgi:hypothetical protein
MMSSWFHKLAQPFQREPRITLQKFSRTRVGILIVQNIGFTLPKSFFAQLGVGNADRFGHCHDNVPFGGDLGWPRPSADVGMKIVACAIPAWQELR